jgi:hypothetical protein
VRLRLIIGPVGYGAGELKFIATMAKNDCAQPSKVHPQEESEWIFN